LNQKLKLNPAVIKFARTRASCPLAVTGCVKWNGSQIAQSMRRPIQY
jgi:hypothetical protein